MCCTVREINMMIYTLSFVYFLKSSPISNGWLYDIGREVILKGTGAPLSSKMPLQMLFVAVERRASYFYWGNTFLDSDKKLYQYTKQIWKSTCILSAFRPCYTIIVSILRRKMNDCNSVYILNSFCRKLIYFDSDVVIIFVQPILQYIHKGMYVNHCLWTTIC